MVEVVGWAGHLKCHLIMAGAKGERERGVSHAHMFPTDTNGNFIPTHTHNGTTRAYTIEFRHAIRVSV